MKRMTNGTIVLKLNKQSEGGYYVENIYDDVGF
jgi:hypothetical protein